MQYYSAFIAPDCSSEDSNLLPLHLTLLGLTPFSDAIGLLISHKVDVNMPTNKVSLC